MAELQVLVVQPRWLGGQALESQWRLVAARYPTARITLLAVPGVQPRCAEFIAMPELWRAPKCTVKNALCQVRATRFDAVVVLAEQRCLQVGSHEILFWAGIARATARLLADGTPLGRREALSGVAVRAAQLLVGRILLRLLTARRPAKNHGGLSRQSLEAFVYLQQLSRRGSGKLLVLGRGGQWFMVAARSHGWDAQWVDGEKPLGEPDEFFQFVTLFDVTDRLALAGMLTDAQMQLAPSGFCLLRTDAMDIVGLTTLAGRCGLRVVESGESLFRAGAVELWLTPAKDEGEGGA